MTHDEWATLLEALEDDLLGRGGGAAPGDERAWRELRREVERAGRLYASRDDLDDVVQNVLVKLQSPDALRRLRAARAPAGYLVVMVRNASTDVIRRRVAQLDAAAIETPVVAAEGAAAAFDRLERAAALRDALARLSDGDRLLLRLRFWQGLTIADIAGRLALPYSTVAVRLFRAQRRLRADLEPPP